MNRQIFRNSSFLFFALFLVVASVSRAYGQGQPVDSSVTASVRVAREAGVPEEALNRLLMLSADHLLEDYEVVKFVSLLQTVQRENLPLDPFTVKIEEGLAKNIPAKIIGPVLEKKIDDYRFVRKALTGSRKSESQAEDLSAEDLSRMVGSLDAGLSREELARFIQRASAADLSMLARATEILALLKQIRFNQSMTEEILFAGLRHNSLTSSWDYLAKVVATAKRRRISDDEIARAAREALEANRTFREFMAALGFTSRDLRHKPALRPSGQSDQ